MTPGVRLVLTDAFTAGWKPAGPSPFMVGTWEIAPEGSGTRFTGAPRATGRRRPMSDTRPWVSTPRWGVMAQQPEELSEAS